MAIPEQETIEAIKRIANTADGRMLRLFVQRKLMEPGPIGNDGALQAFEGGRTFARRLLDLLDQGSEPKSDANSEHIVPAQRQPVASSRPGLERRVPINPPGPGDD